MELNQVYLKTAKGQEEILNRAYKLSANLRRLLIMVDGRSTAADMASRLTMLGDVAAALIELEVGGFIATSVPRVPAFTAAAPEPNSAPVSSQPGFNLDAAKNVIKSALLNAIGPAADYWIECVEVTSTPEQLRLEFDAIHELLPRLLAEPQAEQTWRQMEPVMLSLDRWMTNRANNATSPSPLPSPAAPSPPAPSTPAPGAVPPPAPAEFNLDKAKGVIRFTLLGAMGPTASRRIERVDATTTPQALRVELDGIRDMLPKVLSKRQAEQTWRQLEPILQSISTPSS